MKEIKVLLLDEDYELLQAEAEYMTTRGMGHWTAEEVLAIYAPLRADDLARRRERGIFA